MALEKKVLGVLLKKFQKLISRFNDGWITYIC